MAEYGYGNWDLTAINIVLFASFLLLLPLRRKVKRLPSGVYMAFIVAMFAEMYGFPLTIFTLTWLFGYQNPLTHEASHLLPFVGHNTIGHITTEVMIIAGVLLIVAGWQKIHNAQGKLVTNGIYSIVRHPQYLGILLITSGLLIQWITIPTAIMWPILLAVYYRLAMMEEKEMEDQFGEAYLEYKRKVFMFVPIPKPTHPQQLTTRPINSLSSKPTRSRD
jgi:protein-S-isoprenylcysteine O-methyltransferase Ste14